ncbi:hypothetical protein NEISICOT_03612 [Neisseria sicca ATCC 29256]|uniref:Uncharacterized protein n=1 Tax=Neisseria sicca ATCC 29256 TaxID=547045 RepID=C6MAP0_NEISI|nr:hypothetical protein NEISICOT_03612 [Neisseria sicca ATCC 29256]
MGRISGYLKRNSRKPVLGFRLSEEGLFCKGLLMYYPYTAGVAALSHFYFNPL